MPYALVCSSSSSSNLDFVSSSLGRTHLYHNQFVNAIGVNDPRNVILLSLQTRSTALQFFPFSTLMSSSSSLPLFFGSRGDPASLQSSSSSSSPPPSTSPIIARIS